MTKVSTKNDVKSCIYYSKNEKIKHLKWIKIEENLDSIYAWNMQGICRVYAGNTY